MCPNSLPRLMPWGLCGYSRQCESWEWKVSFKALVEEMVTSDHEAAKKYAMIKRGGYRTYDRHE